MNEIIHRWLSMFSGLWYLATLYIFEETQNLSKDLPSLIYSHVGFFFFFTEHTIKKNMNLFTTHAHYIGYKVHDSRTEFVLSIYIHYL